MDHVVNIFNRVVSVWIAGMKFSVTEVKILFILNEQGVKAFAYSLLIIIDLIDYIQVPALSIW